MNRRDIKLQEFLARLPIVVLSGPWTSAAIQDRIQIVFGRKRIVPWKLSLAEALLARFPFPPGLRDVAPVITEDVGIRAWLRTMRRVPLLSTTRLPAAMLPANAEFRNWNLPEIISVGQLADWLGIPTPDFDWLADPWSWECRRTSLPSRNYRYRWLLRPAKSPRLLEVPKLRLRELQCKILRGILDRIPPHPAAHGFRRGRSVATFAEPHVRRDFVARLDLQHFFGQIRRPRATALFRTIGYPASVATTLAALCTNAVPAAVLEEIRDRCGQDAMREFELAFSTPHLPQGAPTSPALANLVAYRLDCRLANLLAVVGGSYTRYADDLVFSGDEKFARGWPRLKITILAILLDEGFPIRRRKTRTMFHSQRQEVAGLVINQAIHLPRDEYDALKACLFNCVRYGPESQNRNSHADFRAHLQGRIAWFRQIQAERADKLQRLMDRIDWEK